MRITDLDNPVVLDLETYFDDEYNLKKLSNVEYITDERWHLHGIAWATGSDSGWVDGDDAAEALRAMSDKYLVIGHNLHFDAMALTYHYPQFVVNQWLDTRFLAHQILGPAADSGVDNKLATVAERLGLQPKGDLGFLKGVRYPTPEQHKQLVDYAVNDAQITWQVAAKLLPHVTRPDQELPLQDHTIRLVTDRKRSLRVGGAKVDETIEWASRQIKQAVDTLDGEYEVSVYVKGKKGRKTLPDEPDKWEQQTWEPTPPRLRSNKQFERLLASVTDVPTKVSNNGNTIPALSKNDPQFYQLRYHDDPAVAALVEARLKIRSMDLVKARLERVRQMSFDDDTQDMPIQVSFMGTATGRVSGMSGFNWLNLSNPERTSDPVEREAAEAVRGVFMPPSGYDWFVEADLSAIECRVEAWLAGEDTLLEAFRQGKDVYSEFGSRAFGREVRKPTEDDPPDEAKTLGLYRQLSKKAVLGLGYQMGGKKFVQTVAQDHELGPRLGVDFTEKDIRELVGIYRDMYAAIPRLWGRLERAFNAAANGSSRPCRVGYCRFICRHPRKTVQLELPSGRRITYGRLRKDGDQWVSGRGRYIYSGLLAENLTQATARDILMYHQLELERRGYNTLLNVYDSLLVAVKDKPEEAGGEIVDVMRQAPDWCADLPLDAEYKYGRTLALKEKE